MLAFGLEMLRGVWQPAVATTVLQAVCSMFVFGAIGGAIGWLAGWIVDDSVRSRLAMELAAGIKAKAEAAKTAVVKKN